MTGIRHIGALGKHALAGRTPLLKAAPIDMVEDITSMKAIPKALSLATSLPPLGPGEVRARAVARALPDDYFFPQVTVIVHCGGCGGTGVVQLTLTEHLTSADAGAAGEASNATATVAQRRCFIKGLRRYIRLRPAPERIASRRGDHARRHFFTLAPQPVRNVGRIGSRSTQRVYRQDRP